MHAVRVYYMCMYYTCVCHVSFYIQIGCVVLCFVQFFCSVLLFSGVTLKCLCIPLRSGLALAYTTVVTPIGTVLSAKTGDTIYVHQNSAVTP